MAATWAVKVEVLNRASKYIRVTAIRTDDADPDNPFVHITEGATDTAARTLVDIRDRLVAQCVSEYQRQAAHLTQAEAIVATYEAALTAALNAEEPL